MTGRDIAQGECCDCLQSAPHLTDGYFRMCRNPRSRKYGLIMHAHDSCDHYDGVFPAPEKERDNDAT